MCKTWKLILYASPLQYAMQGKRTYKLGERRIKTLLERYAPDTYEFRDVVIIKE